MSKKNNLESNRRDLVRLSIKTTKIVRLLGSLVSIILVAKLFSGLIEGLSLSSGSAWKIAQITILIYYWSWFFAALKGIETQSLLLNTTDKSDRIPFAGYFGLFVGFPIGVAAMTLLLFPNIIEVLSLNYWFDSSTELLVFILAVFWIWDMLWHWSVRKTMRTRIEKTKINLKEKYIELEQLLYLEYFIFGKWRVLRIIIGAIVIGSLVFIIFNLKKDIEIPLIETSVSGDLIIAIIMFLFVIISEGFIWIMRLRMFVGIASLDKISLNYDLKEKIKQVDTKNSKLIKNQVRHQGE